MIASQKLLYLQMSLRIASIPVCFPSTCSTPRVKVPFDLCYQFVVHCGAQACEMALWSCRKLEVEISLPFLEILCSDVQLAENSGELKAQTKLLRFCSCQENGHVVNGLCCSRSAKITI
uniref:PPUP8558 n=1 Tax=Poeciliopsis prolifica TaxID=188132 RepID=A0A0S7ERK9_9TELE